MFRHRWMSFAIVILGLATRPATSWASDEGVIAVAKAVSEAYARAFNEHDAKAIGGSARRAPTSPSSRATPWRTSSSAWSGAAIRSSLSSRPSSR